MILNLCSGPFPQKDCLNVDMIPYAGTNVICDARYLPFKRETFDKVLFIHAIEHFTYDEAMDILKNIKRILKLDGIVVIEGPDIVKSIMNFTDPRRSVQYLFGALDEIRRDSLYTHKWGYTGETLAMDMLRLGFKINLVTQGETHGARKRDYRVEGRAGD